MLGDGAAARRLAELLGCARIAFASPVADRPDLRLRDRELVICALEETPYETLFEVQHACLEAGVPCLFMTLDADGIRIGPSVAPGASPCIACAQVASFRILGLPNPELVAAVAQFRTDTATRETLEPAVRAAAREAAALLAPDGRPALLTSVLLLREPGGRRVYPVTPAVDCTVCGETVCGETVCGETVCGETVCGETVCGETVCGETSRRLAARARRELADVYRRLPRLASSGEGGEPPTSVGIVGGGTAGYLTALALRRKLPHLAVTLIESSALPVIGVGEATTPLMPQFLHVDLGLDAGELFREVTPTLKLGIRFRWGPPGGSFNYPFGPVHVLEPAVYDSDVRRCSPQSLLMSAGAVGLHRENGAWHSRLGVDTAYHLDNERFVRYLKRRATERGVTVVDARIAEVAVAADGESVAALVADDGRRFAFDLYVDCSGFRSLLLEGALGSPFASYADSLFTDRALVASVPHGGVIGPYTLAETMAAGWCWSTPQRDVDHRGYVFCSAFSSPEEAEREMRKRNPGMGEARLIDFRAGRHQHFWKGNVVAMGNAYGFVEPLESTALHMLIRQIGLLLATFPERRGELGAAALTNRKVGAFWDYLSWFLALHYRFNTRLDTPFWRHCRRAVDVSRHGELIELFRERGPLSYQRSLSSIFESPDPLWGAEGIDLLLLGQGVASRLPRPVIGREEYRARVRLYGAVAEGSATQAEALAALDSEPGLLAQWVGAFERFGPAFPAPRKPLPSA